jgi:hypothetical protein
MKLKSNQPKATAEQVVKVWHSPKALNTCQIVV